MGCFGDFCLLANKEIMWWRTFSQLSQSWCHLVHVIEVPTHLFSGWMNLLESLAEFRAIFTYVFWFIRKDIHKDTVELWKKGGKEQGIAKRNWNVHPLLVWGALQESLWFPIDEQLTLQIPPPHHHCCQPCVDMWTACFLQHLVAQTSKWLVPVSEKVPPYAFIMVNWGCRIMLLY